MDDLPDDVLDILCDNVESWRDLIFLGYTCKRIFPHAMKAVWRQVDSQQLAVLLDAQHPDPSVPITYTPELGAAFFSRLHDVYGIHVRSLTIYHTAQSFFVYQCLVAGGGLSRLMPELKRLEIRCEEGTRFFGVLDLFDLAIPTCLTRFALRVVPIIILSDHDQDQYTQAPQTPVAIQAHDNMQRWLNALASRVPSLTELEIIVDEGFDNDKFNNFRLGIPSCTHWKVPYHFEQPVASYLPIFQDLVSLKLSFRHRGIATILAAANLPRLQYLDTRLMDMAALSDISYGASAFPRLQSLTIQPFIPISATPDFDTYRSRWPFPFAPHPDQYAPNLSGLFESITSVGLASIDLPFDNIVRLRDTLRTLRGWRSTLRCVHLYCAPNTSPWEATGDVFASLLPLMEFSLEDVLFDWGRRRFRLRDFDDVQYDRLMSSWPQLRTFVVKGNLFWPDKEPPRASVRTLWNFATKCRYLKTLIVPVDLTSDALAPRLDPQDPASPLTGFYSRTEAYLSGKHNWHSYIHYLFPHIIPELQTELQLQSRSTREFYKYTSFSYPN